MMSTYHCGLDDVMKHEDMRHYGQSLGLWREGKKTVTSNPKEAEIEKIKANIAEREAAERRTQQLAHSSSFQETTIVSQANAGQYNPYKPGQSVAEYYGVAPYTQGLKASQVLDDSIGLQCNLEDELNANHQHVVITDLEDAHKILNNAWVDKGKSTAALAIHLNSVRGGVSNFEPLFDAKKLAKEFGDVGIKADIVTSKGKQFISFSGKKNGKALQHALVNGTRVNMHPKKYPLNGFKAQQVGISPKARATKFKGAAALTFVISASIATANLYFEDDYHLVDWFGNVGADMFKALIQFGAGEAVLFGALGLGASVITGTVLLVVAYLVVEWAWNEYKVSEKVVRGLEYAVED